MLNIMRKSILMSVALICATCLMSFGEKDHQEISSCQQTRKTQYFYCEKCGARFTSVRELTSNKCNRSIGNHKLYEGTEKKSYICKYCGRKFPSIKELTANRCLKNSSGERHAPAL